MLVAIDAMNASRILTVKRFNDWNIGSVSTSFNKSEVSKINIYKRDNASL